jgi:signal transduction histidine kinase
MNYFSTAPLIAAAGNLLLAIFVLLQAPGHKLNRVFFIFGLSVSVWTFGAFMMFQVTSHAEALLWTRLLHIGVIILPIAFFELAMRIARSSLLKFTPFLYGLGITFLVANATPYFIRDVHYVGYGYFGMAGPLYWVFSLTIPSLSIPAFIVLLKRRQETAFAQRHRLSLLTAAVLMLFIFGLHDVGPMFGIYNYPGTQFPVYPIGTAAALVYGGLVAYSVLQHQLLDIRLGLGRVAATFTRLIFLCSIGFMLIFILALAFPDAFSPFSLVACIGVLALSGLVSSVLFPRLLGGGTETLERHLLGDRFEYRDRVKAFIDQLPQYRLIPPLLDDLTSLLSKVLKVEHLQIVLYTPSTLEVSQCRTHPPSLASAVPPPEYNSSLLHLARLHPESRWFDFSDLPDASETGETAVAIRARFVPLKPAFCFPFRSADDISGIVILGSKGERNYYTAVDLDVLSELFGEVSILIDQIHFKDQLGVTEKLESLAVMSRGLAHDLNNLLTPINTYIQLTASLANPGDPENELLDIASKNLSSIKTYIREAVFFSTTLTPKIAPLSARALLDELASVCRHQLDKNNITLVIDLPAAFHFHADIVLLQRLLSNLVFNAVDASPPGSSVTVSAAQLPLVPGRPRWLRLQIIDRGSGISRENLTRVFAPYFTTKNLGDQTRGFGLGLTICQKIVHLHRGTITLHSTEGLGTTVQIDLPAEPAEPPATASSS